jgi:hypothetical protein
MINKVLRLVLTLPLLTTTKEHVFSTMEILKQRL